MTVSDETLALARRGNRRAIEAVVLDSFPAVYRIAHALTGRHATAARVIRLVLQRGMRLLPTWRQGMLPDNWFYHHTVLAARSAAAAAPDVADARQDILVTAAADPAPAYVAFVRALRKLPPQQMEAFVLHHGEKLNSRLLGVAMDCSTGAAANHLQAATAALDAVSGGQTDALAATLSRAYAGLSPAETDIVATVHKQVAANLWSRRLRRLVRRLALLALLAAAAWAGWHWRADLLKWWDAIRTRATTT